MFVVLPNKSMFPNPFTNVHLFRERLSFSPFDAFSSALFLRILSYFDLSAFPGRNLMLFCLISQCFRMRSRMFIR